MRLLFFAGSTREGSFNKKLARLAQHISIANGIAFGFISWVVIKGLAGRFKDLNPALVVLAALFIIKFGFFNA